MAGEATKTIGNFWKRKNARRNEVTLDKVPDSNESKLIFMRVHLLDAARVNGPNSWSTISRCAMTATFRR